MEDKTIVDDDDGGGGGRVGGRVGECTLARRLAADSSGGGVACVWV